MLRIVIERETVKRVLKSPGDIWVELQPGGVLGSWCDSQYSLGVWLWVGPYFVFVVPPSSTGGIWWTSIVHRWESTVLNAGEAQGGLVLISCSIIIIKTLGVHLLLCYKYHNYRVSFLTKSQSFRFNNKDSEARCWGEKACWLRETEKAPSWPSYTISSKTPLTQCPSLLLPVCVSLSPSSWLPLTL